MPDGRLAVNIGMLDTTGPIFLVLLSRIFLKTPITNRQLIGLTVAVIGVVIIILRGDFTALSKIKTGKRRFVRSGQHFCLCGIFAAAIQTTAANRSDGHACGHRRHRRIDLGRVDAVRGTDLPAGGF